MKRFLVFLTFVGATLNGFAQNSYQLAVQPTGGRLKTISGFGGPTIELSTLKGQAAFSVGGGGAALFNERFFFGGFGQQTVTSTPLMVGNSSYNLKLNQGGLWAGYLSRPSKLLTIQADTRFGWSTVGLGNRSQGGTTYRSDGFVWTPSMGVQINASDFFRINISGGYRLATGIDLPLTDRQGQVVGQLSNRDFSGLTGAITFLFGRF